MEAAIVLGVALVMLAAIVLLKSVRPVPQDRVGVVERLGRFQRTIKPGLNLIVPFIDRVRTLVDTREQIASFSPLLCVTADSVPVKVAARLYYQITEPARVVYEVANYVDALEHLTLFGARSMLGEMTLEQAKASYYQLSSRLQEAVTEDARRWGITLARLEVTSIEPTSR